MGLLLHHHTESMGNIKHEDIKTIKQLNSWRGLFKTLIGHLPHLSHFMAPFDKYASSRKSSDPLTWPPDLLLAFKEAKAQLQEINKTYLPKPTDQLILKPDSAKVDTCSGWVLYAQREANNTKQLLPVMFCSARLPEYMGKWCIPA